MIKLDKAEDVCAFCRERLEKLSVEIVELTEAVTNCTYSLVVESPKSKVGRPNLVFTIFGPKA